MPDSSTPPAQKSVSAAVGVIAGVTALLVAGGVVVLRPSTSEPVGGPVPDAGPTPEAAPPAPTIVGLAECGKQRAGGAPSTPPKTCTEGGDATAIRAGSPTCAQAYYAESIATGPHGLGVFDAATMMKSSLNDLLDFLGTPLRVVDLEKTASTTLTTPSAPPRGVLAVSIFAPKITNVSSGSVQKYGWRKLVRILPAATSRAIGAGIEKAYILLNYFQSDLTKSPFVDGSINTQAILVSSPASVQHGHDLAYWLDYDASVKGAPLSLSLPATFDGRFPAQDDPTRKYFIPDGCISCHGESVTHPLLNYFDTDHFEDRLQSDNDFGAVTAAGEHMFADEGVGCTHDQCFEVMRQLNEEMFAENLIAQPCSIELQAANNWLSRHAGSSAHLSPTQRPLHVTVRPQAGVPSLSPNVWTDSDDDRALLGLLNRYCFRCHGSIRFNVFDKDEVLEKRELVLLKIGPSARGRDAMPTDRTLPSGDQQRLTALMNQLGEQ